MVFLDVDNDLFEAKYNPTLYSAVIPTQENVDKGTCFYVGSVIYPSAEYNLNDALLEYNRRLIDILDEILDTCEFPEYFFIPPKPVEGTSGPRLEFMIDGGNRPKREELPLDKLSRLEITPTTYDILLPDYNREFKFTTQVKALYVLFLLHPEGIRMKEWYKYKDEYSKLYFLFTNRSDIDKIRQSINKLFDMYSTNALEVKKSQCNTTIRYILKFKENIYKYYVIEPSWARPHRIRLDRKLVTIPDNLR